MINEYFRAVFELVREVDRTIKLSFSAQESSPLKLFSDMIDLLASLISLPFDEQ